MIKIRSRYRFYRTSLLISFGLGMCFTLMFQYGLINYSVIVSDSHPHRQVNSDVEGVGANDDITLKKKRHIRAQQDSTSDLFFISRKPPYFPRPTTKRLVLENIPQPYPDIGIQDPPPNPDIEFQDRPSNPNIEIHQGVQADGLTSNNRWPDIPSRWPDIPSTFPVQHEATFDKDFAGKTSGIPQQPKNEENKKKYQVVTVERFDSRRRSRHFKEESHYSARNQTTANELLMRPEQSAHRSPYDYRPYQRAVMKQADRNLYEPVETKSEDEQPLERKPITRVPHKATGLLLRANRNKVNVLKDKQNVRTSRLRIGNLQIPVSEKDISSKELCLVEGIFWTSSMKEFLPKGQYPEQADTWLRMMRGNKVTALRAPRWNECGRPKNAVAVIDGGLQVCARYRAPHDNLVLGEVMSYWLSRFLGLTNVPPVALSRVNSSQWSSVSDAVHQLYWQQNQYTALIMWISEIATGYKSTAAYMPEAILQAIRTGQPWMPKARPEGGQCLLDTAYQAQASGAKGSLKYSDHPLYNLTQLVQWGNMIIFDYLTGNYDRVASMLDAEDKENSPSALKDQIRNLRMSESSGLLWLIDNESGLFDAYELLYQEDKESARFHRFHKTLLQTTCVFDKTVIDNVRRLSAQRRPHRFLETFAAKQDTLVQSFPTDSSYYLFDKYFSSRLKDVLEWVQRCKRLLYGFA